MRACRLPTASLPPIPKSRPWRECGRRAAIAPRRRWRWPISPGKSAMKNARHKARELALQGLYQWLLAREDAQEIRTHLAEFKGYDKVDQKYLEQLLNGVIADAAELEAAFSPLLDRPTDEL